MNRGLCSMGLLDLLDQPAGQVRHPLLELADGLAEILVGRLGIGEKGAQQIGKLLRVGQVDLHRLLAVLVEVRLARVLEDGVA